MSISKNLAHLHEQITEACRRSNRPESDVALMAVTKVHPVEAILEAYAAGQRLFGENRVQEFQEKSPLLKELARAEFHLIEQDSKGRGAVQRNRRSRLPEDCPAPEHNGSDPRKEAAGTDRSEAELRRIETRPRSRGVAHPVGCNERARIDRDGRADDSSTVVGRRRSCTAILSRAAQAA